MSPNMLIRYHTKSFLEVYESNNINPYLESDFLSSINTRKGDKVIDGAMVFLKVNSSLTTLTIFFNPCTSSSRSRKYNKDELTFTKCYSFEIYTLSYLKCFEMYPFHTWSTNKFLYITCMPYYDVQLTLFANISKGFPLYPHTITREMSCSENT